MIPAEYVIARKVLLDALVALGAQRKAVILVGAQAVYLQVGEANLAVPVMTTDGDLMLNPHLLVDIPLINAAMLAGGFVAMKQPGAWQGEHHVQIDLMVAEALGNHPGHRGADLGVHGRTVARQARGLEAAMVDQCIIPINSFEAHDLRSFNITVAGPAALLVAKLLKIAERVGTKRLEDKDGLDVLRLLRGTQTEALAQTFSRLVKDAISATVTKEALIHLETLFAHTNAVGCQMAARAAWPMEHSDVIAGSCAALTGDLLDGLRIGTTPRP